MAGHQIKYRHRRDNRHLPRCVNLHLGHGLQPGFLSHLPMAQSPGSGSYGRQRIFAHGCRHSSTLNRQRPFAHRHQPTRFRQPRNNLLGIGVVPSPIPHQHFRIGSGPFDSGGYRLIDLDDQIGVRPVPAPFATLLSAPRSTVCQILRSRNRKDSP